MVVTHPSSNMGGISWVWETDMKNVCVDNLIATILF